MSKQQYRVHNWSNYNKSLLHLLQKHYLSKNSIPESNAMDSNLKQNIIKIYGAKGKQWLDSLPEITAKIANNHNLSGLTPVNNMTFNYVASGYQNENPIILKIGMNSKALTKEASCLQAFSKHAVRTHCSCHVNIITL